MSLHEILKTITKEKLVPIGKTLSKSGIEGILMNKFYGGTYMWHGEEYKGKHELIIPPDHFKAVHSPGKKIYSKKPTGLFGAWLRCANPECGCQILYDPKRKKLAKTGEVKTYHFYHCSDGKRIHKLNGERQKVASERELLEMFEKPVKEISISDELAKAISRELKKSHDKAAFAHKRNLEGYKNAIIQTEKEEDKAYELLANGVVDQDMYQRQVLSIRDKKRKYEDLLEEGQLLVTAKFYETSEFILELAKNAESFWNDRNDNEKLEFLKRILSNQTLTTYGTDLDKVTIEYDLKEPFKELAKIKKSSNKRVNFAEDFLWCPLAESNHGHKDFQSFALPTELSGHIDI